MSGPTPFNPIAAKTRLRVNGWAGDNRKNPPWRLRPIFIQAETDSRFGLIQAVGLRAE